jgi:hypothetical protein
MPRQSEAGWWGRARATRCALRLPAGTRLGTTCVPAVYAAALTIPNATTPVAGQPLGMQLRSSTHPSQVGCSSRALLLQGST